MIKKDISFTNLISLLHNIPNSLATTEYFGSLTDVKRQDDFISLVVDGIERERKEIERCHNVEIHYGNISGLIQILENVGHEFPDFKILRKNEILLILTILAHISNQIPDLTDLAPVNVADFDIVCMDTVLNDMPVNYFHFINSISFADSLIFFSFEDVEKVKDEINNRNPDLTLLFILLSKLGRLGNELSNRYYVLVKGSETGSLLRIKSAFFLHLVSNGIFFHKPKQYSNPIVNNWQQLIRIENKYQQFFETMYVLSEYNYAKDILNKYLNLYQIIEDFMYKINLVTLERANGGKFFSIRDFKRMYETVSDSEMEALQGFIKNLFPMLYAPGTTFKDYVSSQFNALVASHVLSESQINALLSLFQIKTPKRTLYTYNMIVSDSKTLNNVLAQLVYKIRNSIVHNKTTEFHLTYGSITEEIYKLLQCFLMPSLESCIFFLTSDANNHSVRFGHSKLQIWEDS